MSRDDPFSGLLLSDQGSHGPLDQQLFKPSPRPEPPIKAQKQAAATEVAAPPPARPSIPDALRPATLTRYKFDLDELPLFQANYLFTPEELEALDDLKIELRREHSQKASKQDLQRLAVHLLIEDYREKGKDSFVCRKLTRRIPK